MQNIQEILEILGDPDDVKIYDQEECIHRDLGEYEFEVSGACKSRCTLYVWKSSPHVLVGIYTNIPAGSLKDVLGHFACLYQNLLAEIRVERQEIM